MKIPFRRSFSKLHVRTDSTQSQPKVPLLQKEVVEDTRSKSHAANVDPRRRDTHTENMVPHGYDTMLDLISQKKAELLHFGSEQSMSTLQDLSNMLYTRGRLQELGCTFTPPGELLTYGHPATLYEFEQLLRLGPIYDEQWSLFFNREAAPNVDDGMWADLRTLKRVLTNEGVEFGQDHDRLTFGDGSSKLHRLCAAYDDLYKLWSAMLPERALTPHQEEEEVAANANDDSGCFVEDDVETEDGVEDQVTDELKRIEHETRPGTEVPRNIGWRFSDDIDEANLKRYRESASLSDDDLDAMEAAAREAALALAVVVPLPEDLSRPSSPIRPASPFKTLKSKASKEPLKNASLARDNPFKTHNKKASKESLKPTPARSENPFKALNAKSKQSAKADLLSPPPPAHTRGRYGPSPLQVRCWCSHKHSPSIEPEQLTEPKVVTTISMVCVDESKVNAPRIDNTSIDRPPCEDGDARDSGTKTKTRGSGCPDTKKKRGGLRGWARGVWDKAWSPMQDANMDRGNVGSVGGWW